MKHPSIPPISATTKTIDPAKVERGVKKPDPVKQPLMKKSKYRAIKTEIDGNMFDSKKEARRYGQLKLMEKGGLITDLKYEKKDCTFPIEIMGKIICKYISDFCYLQDGKQVVEDVKGIKTPVYNLKKKLVKALYNIDIKEV